MSEQPSFLQRGMGWLYAFLVANKLDSPEVKLMMGELEAFQVIELCLEQCSGIGDFGQVQRDVDSCHKACEEFEGVLQEALQTGSVLRLSDDNTARNLTQWLTSLRRTTLVQVFARICSSSYITHSVKAQIENLSIDTERFLMDKLAQEPNYAPKSEINMEPAFLQRCLARCSVSLEDIRSAASKDCETFDFSSRGEGLSVYTVADLESLLPDTPKPRLYMVEGRLAAFAIIGLELDTAQSIITASEWLAPLSEKAGEMFSKPTVRRLIDKKLDKSMLEKCGECVICRVDLAVGQSVAVLPCTHWFQRPCIVSWLQSNHICPYCRTSVSGGENL